MIAKRSLSFVRSTGIYYCGEIKETLLIAVVREMPIFKKPIFLRKNPVTGETQNCYRFEVEREEKDESLEWVADQSNDLSLSCLSQQLLENTSWWMDLLRQFLQAHLSMFSKAYTAEQLQKVIKHEIMITTQSVSHPFPFFVSFFPITFQVNGGTFIVQWSYETRSLSIDIPDSESITNTVNPLIALPDLKTDVLEEVDMDQIPIDKNPTDTSVDPSASIRQMDRHRVKEARLKAKVSLYKAQLQMRHYYDKYGEEYEDSEYDTEDETSDEESDEEIEEIQL